MNVLRETLLFVGISVLVAGVSGCDEYTSATQVDCEAYADQYFSLRSKGDLVEKTKNWLDEQMGKDAKIRKCQAVMTRSQARCAIAASSIDQMTKCGASL